ncbi:hypothetical protein ACFVFQ_36970 [Streptomyces sp. NPDC057743]|uniref:hypothetical protein n=1 Tax=Streptomyces sp. NPDC057743 TaxID=3346236 RepID=UPI0036C8E07C
MLCATFVQLLNVTVAQTTAPVIRTDQGAGPGAAQLIPAGDPLTHACLLITAARLGVPAAAPHHARGDDPGGLDVKAGGLQADVGQAAGVPYRRRGVVLHRNQISLSLGSWVGR